MLQSILYGELTIQEALPVKECVLLEFEPNLYIEDNLDPNNPGRAMQTFKVEEADAYITAFRNHHPGVLLKVAIINHE